MNASTYDRDTYAFGVLLRLTSTDQGGRRTALLGGSGPDVMFWYRPNWGLPEMTPPEQTGAPVLAFSREHIQPGEQAHAVIVPPFPQMMAEWSRVRVGDVLPMYEGARVCGHGQVLWRRDTHLPMSDQDAERFRAWVVDAASAPEPPD